MQNVIEIEFLGTESIIPNKDLANDREVRDQEVSFKRKDEGIIHREVPHNVAYFSETVS